jgi:hypothetical protein
MMEDFLELLKKKAKDQNGPKMDEKMSAKASMAKELSDMLAGDLNEGIKNSKKVTVASDSEEGLKEGLEKAGDLLESKMEKEESEDESEDMEESEDDLKSQIAMLKKEIENLKKR